MATVTRSDLSDTVYRRALLQALQALERQRREGRRIGLELAELIGRGPGSASGAGRHAALAGGSDLAFYDFPAEH